jgi:hypothetical protein
MILMGLIGGGLLLWVYASKKAEAKQVTVNPDALKNVKFPSGKAFTPTYGVTNLPSFPK